MLYCDMGKLSFTIKMKLFSQSNQALQPELNYISACNYKGKDYVVGDKWDDGCDLSCECLANGAYSCKQK